MLNVVNEVILSRAVAAYALPVAETLATYRATRKVATPGDLLAPSDQRYSAHASPRL